LQNNEVQMKRRQVRIKGELSRRIRKREWSSSENIHHRAQVKGSDEF
jgi:hypothetical protein